MPFIEDEWWSAENEGRMVDLSNCLQDAVAASGHAATQLQLQMATSLGEMSQAELSNFVGGLTLEADGSEAADPDDILKQLGETAFDNFDTFFTDLTNSTASGVPHVEIKQEENNNISPTSGSQLQNSYYQQSQHNLPNNGQQRLQQLLRSGTSAINHAVANNITNGRYNIASANPLLAEKLAATSSGIKQEPMSSDYNGTSMNYGNASPMQRVPSGKPQVHDAGGGKVDGEPTALSLGARGSLSRALLHGLLAPTPAPRHHLYTAPNTGSLPPSPADSGVSDVESSSSGAGSAEELKARLQPPPAPFHAPFLPFYQQHHIASSLQHHAAAHPRPPVGNVERDAYGGYGYGGGGGGGGGGRGAPLRRARAAAPAARRPPLLRVRLRRLPAPPVPQQAQTQEEAPRRRAPRARRQAQEPRGLHHLPVGVPAEAAAGPRVLPALHQVDEPREGRLQARRLQGRLAALGPAQEQTGHELRDHGPSAALLLPAGDPRQSGRTETRLPIRRRTERYSRDRLLARVDASRPESACEKQ